jgi:hypothetical protein
MSLARAERKRKQRGAAAELDRAAERNWQRDLARICPREPRSLPSSRLLLDYFRIVSEHCCGGQFAIANYSSIGNYSASLRAQNLVTKIAFDLQVLHGFRQRDTRQ